MHKETEKVIRKTFHIPDNELLTVWRLPGWRGCPLGDPDIGITNCPMGFDTGKWSPNNPPPWMLERLGKEILAYCQRCQGKPHFTPEEEQIWVKSIEVLMGGNK